jgi:hypothetical protein
MKKTLLALLAATALSAQAGNEVVPLRHISSLDIFAQEVTMSTEDQSWVVTHDCNLYMSNSSEVSVRPAHKTHMLPHRMNRLGTWDSLVITVDGRKNVCKVNAIDKLDTQLIAAR